MIQAEKRWIRNCQTVTYHKEINNISSKVSNRLPLVRQLRLFLDDDGLFRCGGRIHNSPLAELAKFLYLLPANHPLTALIVYATHRKQPHAGVNSTTTALRQKYWIPTVRQYVKKLLRCCVTCRKVGGTAYRAPDPPPLPEARLQQSTSFTVTGVDSLEHYTCNQTEVKAEPTYVSSRVLQPEQNT